MKSELITSAKYPGVSWRVGRDGTKTFYIRYNDPETRMRVVKSVGTSRDRMSEAKAAILRKAAAQGKLIEQQEPESPCATWEELFSKYLDATPIQLAAERTARSLFSRHLMPLIGMIPPESITTRDFDKLRTGLSRQKLNPSSVKSAMSLALRLLRFGDRFGIIVMPHVSVSYPRFRSDKTEMFTEEQAARYVQALNAEPDTDAADFLRILMLTGMRPKALANLKWSDVIFEHSQLRLRAETAKNQTTAYITVCTPVMEILRDRASEKQDREYVFALRHGRNLRDGNLFLCAARRVKKRAGLPDDFRPQYCLRHNFASQLACSGKVDLYAIQQAMTHKSISMTQRYAHLTDAVARRTASVAEEVIIAHKAGSASDSK